MEKLFLKNNNAVSLDFTLVDSRMYLEGKHLASLLVGGKYTSESLKQNKDERSLQILFTLPLTIIFFGVNGSISDQCFVTYDKVSDCNLEFKELVSYLICYVLFIILSTLSGESKRSPDLVLRVEFVLQFSSSYCYRRLEALMLVLD